MGTHTKTPRTSKKNMSDEEIAEASLTKNMGVLTDSQRQQATLLLRSQYTQDCLREGKIVPFTWLMAAEMMRNADFALNSSEYRELNGTEHTRELMKQIKELFPYDRQKWDSHRQFVCRADARDSNGKAPGIGFILLPIDPSRQQTLPLEVASHAEEVDK